MARAVASRNCETIERDGRGGVQVERWPTVAGYLWPVLTSRGTGQPQVLPVVDSARGQQTEQTLDRWRPSCDAIKLAHAVSGAEVGHPLRLRRAVKARR